MALDPETKLRVERALVVVDDHGTRGMRLIEDARRLCGRIGTLIKLDLIGADTEPAPMELACYALQLPLKTARPTGGKAGRTTLRERAEQAAEMLASLLTDPSQEALLEGTTQLLHQVYQKKPEMEVARLLADALNLEDFGAVGLVLQALQVARQGGSVQSVADGCRNREVYGYWDARLKDGFHFEQVRQIARKRLEAARKIAGMLGQELKEDGV